MYKRIVLKLSGEALSGTRDFGLDADKVAEIAGEVVEVPAIAGSNMNIPPAPTVKLDPVGRASGRVTISVPAATNVPPV